MPDKMTVENYVDAVENALQYWLDIHTVAEKWAEVWIIDDDIEYTFKECPVISNGYFTFEWRDSALRQMAENEKHMYNVCSSCGCINENGFENCCEEPQSGDEPGTEDLMWWFKDIEAQPNESALMDSLINDGFEVYQEALNSTIAPIVGEVTEVLEAIRSADTQEDKLQAVMWGTRVYHVHGNIMSDYSDRANYEIDLDYKIIDSIRNDGLESVFSRDEIEKYLIGE